MNATHALNAAMASLVKEGARVAVSGFEHNSVVRPLRQRGAKISVAGTRLFDRADTLYEFRRALEYADVCVCTYVSNAFGYILPIYEIAEMCAHRGVPLIVDASQAAGVLPVDFQALKARYIAMPGHKGLYGPQGTGILLCAEPGAPFMSGGTGSDSLSEQMPAYLPDRLEAGTVNTPGIAGLAAGMDFVRTRGESSILRHELELLGLLREELRKIKGLKIFDGGTWQSGVISIMPEKLDCETAAQALSERDICIRSGLHCAPLAHKSAGTVHSGTIRISFSSFNTEREVRKLCAALKEILENK